MLVSKYTSFVGNQQYHMIQALQIINELTDENQLFQNVKKENYIYLLISQEKIDASRYFDKNELATSKMAITIYPPW